MNAPTQHWALADDELIRLVDDALPTIPPDQLPLILELLNRFQFLTLERDDLK